MPEEEIKPTRPDVLAEARKLVQDGAEATHTKNRVSSDLTTFAAKHKHAIVLVEGHNFCHREIGSAWPDGIDERERNVRDLVLITDIQYNGTTVTFTALSLSIVNKYGESREWRFNLSELTSFAPRLDFMTRLRDLAKAELDSTQSADEPVAEPVSV